MWIQVEIDPIAVICKIRKKTDITVFLKLNVPIGASAEKREAIKELKGELKEKKKKKKEAKKAAKEQNQS